QRQQRQRSLGRVAPERGPDERNELHAVFSLRGGVFQLLAGKAGTTAASKRQSAYRKLCGQIIVRHMCATGDPSKPSPSFGCLKFRPITSSNSPSSTVTAGSNE